MLIAAGLLLALLAVLLVLEPLLRAAQGREVRLAEPIFADSDDEDDPVLRRRDRALAALREIEFDRATGKLSDDDYQRLYARYSAEALEAIHEADAAAQARAAEASAGAPGPGDAVEALIASARAEASRAGRRYCIECGAALEGSGRFCVECGTRVGV
jgi:hypothetical protein